MRISHTFVKDTLLETRYYVYLICTSHIKLFLSSQLLYPRSWHPKTEISDLKQWCVRSSVCERDCLDRLFPVQQSLPWQIILHQRQFLNCISGPGDPLVAHLIPLVHRKSAIYSCKGAGYCSRIGELWYPEEMKKLWEKGMSYSCISLL